MADYKNNRADRSSRRPAPASRGPVPQADPRTGRTGFPRPNVAATNSNAGNRADRSSTRARPQFAVDNIPAGQQNTPGWRPPASAPSTWQQRVDARNSGTRPGAPGGPAAPPAGGLGGIPASVNPPGWNGAAYQAALERGGTVNGAKGDVPAPVPPRPAPGAGAPPPEPVRLGPRQERINPATGQPVNPVTPAGFTSIQPGTFAPGAISIDKDALARAAWGGEGFTNKLNIQAEDNSKVFANGLISNPNGFALAGNLLGGTAMPSQPGTGGFAAAAGMSPLVDTMGAGSVPMSASSPTPGVVPAAFGTGSLLGAAPAAEAAVAPEEAAQNFASGAVNGVMSLQNQIRERRGMPLLVE